MTKVYKRILSPSQCFSISEAMFAAEKNDPTVMVEQNRFYNGSVGKYNLREALRLLPVVANIVGRDVRNFENAFTRIYRNGCHLKPHTDRPGLDHTLSICVYSDAAYDWPLCISNIACDGLWDAQTNLEKFSVDFAEFTTPVGDGVMCEGTRMAHWREKLICGADCAVVQTFYHWNDK